MPVTIRKLTARDLDALAALLADEEVMRYLEPPFSPAQAAHFLQTAGLSNPPLIFAAEADGAFIGYVIDHDYDETSREIGWVLRREVWGRGYAKALTRLLIERARAAGKTAVLECAPQQEATKHIARLFGFSPVGTRDGCEVYRLQP